jgi:ABC-type glycerol-3-phosphate transport system substrate-binding protein
MRLRILRTPVGWMTVLLVSCLWWGLGCGSTEPLPAPDITYTFDSDVQEIISILAKQGKVPYKEFDQKFTGLYVPNSLFSQEPFVLGLSTESRIPAILLLRAQWVKRYGKAGWLHVLESQRSQIKFPKEELVPAVAEAFAVAPGDSFERKGKILMAVPTRISGNILFFRQDLLERYHATPPRTWDELKDICRKIVPQEKQVKYGLVLQPSRFSDDFYPIFWGLGGHIVDGDQFVLAQVQNQAAFLKALREVLGMQGTILPAAKDMKQFDKVEAVQQSFLKGEVLFVIHANSFMKDLSDLLIQTKGSNTGGITQIGQVGVAPIPSSAGHSRHYTNLDSLGWGVNYFAATAWNALQVMAGVKQFLQLVVNDQFQLQAAETSGEVPSLRSALKKLQNKEVLRVYNDVFASPDLVFKVKPSSRVFNHILEKHLLEALYGQRTPEEALQAVLHDLQ